MARPQRRSRTNGWPFSDPTNFAVFTLSRVLSGASSVPRVLHDDDGSWQFLDHGEASENQAKVVALEEMIRHDPTLIQVAALPRGWYAVREESGSSWWVAPYGMSIQEAYATTPPAKKPRAKSRARKK